MSSKNSTALGREREAEETVPYIGHITPEVMLMIDDRVMGMFHLAGVPFETADEADLNALHQQLNVLLRNVASDRLVIYLHLVRGHDGYYPGGTFRSTFAREVDAQYRQKMLGRDRFRNDLYLSVIRRTPRHPAEGLTRLFRKIRPVTGEALQDAAQGLEDTMATLKAGLGPYGPHRLGLRAENGVTFTEIGEALRRIMFGEWLPVPLVAGSLGPALYSERVIFGRESLEIRGPGHQAFGAVFGIKEYPGQTYPGQFDTILGAPYRCVLTQGFAFLGKSAAHAILTRKQNQMVSAQDKAASQMDELTEAADQLQSNHFVMGEHHLALMVLSDRLKDLPDLAAQARRDLAESGAVIVREDLAMEAGYWSQLPGNMRWRVRPAAVTSRNFAAMAAMHDYPRGPRAGHWGEPVVLLQGVGATPYEFHFHVNDVGDAVVFGPKGSGKTVFLGFALTMAEKTGARCVLFDKDRGAEIVARALGGTYLALQNGQPTGLAPLRALAPTPANLEFLRGWIAILVAGDTTLNPAEEKAVELGVSAIMKLPPEHRSLRELRAMLGQTDPNGIGPRLEKWTAGRALGWVFDNDADQVRLDAPFVGFDMTQILDNPDICGPAMAYLFYRVEALVTGQRLIIAIDEFWKALSFKVFEDFAENKIKVIRKQNGIMLFATQSVKDALKSPIGHSIIQECQTQILFPNSKGQPDDYIAGIGCTPAEYELVSQELPGTRAFLLKQGTNSLVAQLDLGGMDDALAVISGRTKTVELADRLRAEHGDDPDRWLPHFYRLWRSVPRLTGKRRKRMSSFIRKLLLVSSVLVPVLVGHGAHAQIPVTDAGSIAQLIHQVTTAGQQLQQLQQQYNQMVQQYNSLAKLTNMGSIEGQLLSPLNQNPMMPDANQAMAFLNGGSMAGQGQAGTNAQSLFTQNHVYTSSTPGFLGTEMTRNANSVAALMGAAQQLYATAQSRISGLSNLQAQLNSAHDPKDVLDLQARLQSEGTFIQNQQQQAQALMTVAQMQQANERERYQEQRQSDIATAIRNAQGW